MKLDNEQELFLSELYKEMYRPLASYAYSILGDIHAAEEAVQETFRIACSKIGVLMSSENPKGWLTITLKNVLRNIRKSDNRTHKKTVSVGSLSEIENHVVSLQPSDDSFIMSYSEAEVDILYSDLVKESDFKLIKLVILDKLTVKEAAQVLGLTEEACKKQLQRAKKRLRTALEEI